MESPAPRRPPRAERAFLFNVWGLLAGPLLLHALLLFWASKNYSLVLRVRCEQPLGVQIDLDTGLEYGEGLRFAAILPGERAEQKMRVAVPMCHLQGLRLHLQPGGQAASPRVGDVQITSDADEALGWGPGIAALPAARLARVQQIAGVTAEDAGWARIDTQEGASEAVGEWTFVQPLELGFNGRAFVARLAIDLSAYVVAGLGALLLWRRSARAKWAGRKMDAAQTWAWTRAARFGRGRPTGAIWLAALAGVLLSNYPVVFCGRSFVSPNMTLPLLYDRLPSLPGYTDARPANNQLSDVAATMLQSVPWAVTQRRAMFHDHELPVWNRMDAGGIPLLGQGLSMIGDPLHWIPILANSASWAWDLKILLMKLLFAAGIGLTVRETTRHLPSALLLGFCSCFIGYFIFRLNHATLGAVCYAPWILYAWARLTREGGRRQVGLLLLANWMEFNSGTAKEPAMLMLNLNAGGALAFWLSSFQSHREKQRLFLRLLFAGGCFLLVAAPLWLTLLDTISHSWNGYQTPRAWQIQPGAILGLFDDIYYRQFNLRQGLYGGERLYNAGLNFVILLGVALAVSYFKALLREGFFVAFGLAVIPPLAMVFGVVPEGFITALPFVGNIVHVDTTFTCPLAVLLPLLAGFGFRECSRRFGCDDWPKDVLVAVIVLAVMLGAFAGLAQASQSASADLRPAVQVSLFCWTYTAVLAMAFIALPFVLRQMWRERAATLFGYAPLLGLCLVAMMWRNALHLPGLSFQYVMSPGVRVDLLAPSPATGFIRERLAREPGRAMGFGSNLAPGFSGVYGLESPSGPDALQNAYYHDLLAGSGVRYWSNWYLVADRPPFARAQKFLDLLNVRYYVDSPGHFAEHAGLKSAGRFDLDVYESETAWPRAFFTDCVTTHGALPDFYRQIDEGDGRPFVSLSPLAPELTALVRDPAARLVVPAVGYQLTSASTSFRVRAPGPGVITLLEGYQKEGVEVTVNGRPAPHFRVNAAFSGIYVSQAGDYLVRYRYWPRFLTAGLGMAAAGLLLLGGYFTVAGASDRRRTGQTPARAIPGRGDAATPRDAP